MNPVESNLTPAPDTAMPDAPSRALSPTSTVNDDIAASKPATTAAAVIQEQIPPPAPPQTAAQSPQPQPPRHPPQRRRRGPGHPARSPERPERDGV